MSEIFPIINIKGTPEEIGFQIGTKISARIHKALNFYKVLWQKNEEIILEETQHFVYNFRIYFRAHQEIYKQF